MKKNHVKICIFAYVSNYTLFHHFRQPKFKTFMVIYVNFRSTGKEITGYPIEKYVGWTVTLSNFIFNISSVIPLLEILPQNLWIDLCIHI